MYFFFQAEDGIRDDLVTGVQTCALPISRRYAPRAAHRLSGYRSGGDCGRRRGHHDAADSRCPPERMEIGRASCRERVEISVVAVSLKKKRSNIKAASNIPDTSSSISIST